MAGQSGLKFCIDEALGRPLASALCLLRAPGAPNIHDMRELSYSGVSDEVWLAALPRDGVHVVVTKDSRILNATVRRDVWRTAGLSLFVLDAKWGNLTLFEQARRLIWWWPVIAAQAALGPQGAAWRVSADMSAGGMQRLFGEPADGSSAD